MYSVEFDHDEVLITLVDDTADCEDVVINSFDDIVYIRQWDEELNRMQAIVLTPEMWEELMSAIHSHEGVFIRERK